MLSPVPINTGAWAPSLHLAADFKTTYNCQIYRSAPPQLTKNKTNNTLTTRLEDTRMKLLFCAALLLIVLGSIHGVSTFLEVNQRKNNMLFSDLSDTFTGNFKSACTFWFTFSLHSFWKKNTHETWETLLIFQQIFENTQAYFFQKVPIWLFLSFCTITAAIQIIICCIFRAQLRLWRKEPRNLRRIMFRLTADKALSNKPEI